MPRTLHLRLARVYPTLAANSLSVTHDKPREILLGLNVKTPDLNLESQALCFFVAEGGCNYNHFLEISISQSTLIPFSEWRFPKSSKDLLPAFWRLHHITEQSGFLQDVQTVQSSFDYNITETESSIFKYNDR